MSGDVLAERRVAVVGVGVRFYADPDTDAKPRRGTGVNVGRANVSMGKKERDTLQQEGVWLSHRVGWICHRAVDLRCERPGGPAGWLLRRSGDEALTEPPMEGVNAVGSQKAPVPAAGG